MPDRTPRHLELAGFGPARFDLVGFTLGAVQVGKSVLGGGAPEVSKEQALQGQHQPGPYNVLAVHAAYLNAPPAVQAEGLREARRNPGFNPLWPNPSTADALTIARVLVWQGHGAENGECGSNCQPTRAYLNSLLSAYGVSDAQGAPYAPTPTETRQSDDIAQRAIDVAHQVEQGAEDFQAGVQGARAGVAASDARQAAAGIDVNTGILIAGGAALAIFAFRRR